MRIFDFLIRPTRDEIERAENYLVDTFGAGAAQEALRLCDVSRRVGSTTNARLYRLVAGRLSQGEPAPAARPGDDDRHE